MTPHEMRNHIQALCEQHNIAVQHCERLHQSYALHDLEEVVIPHVKSELSYATALHEIGHVLGQNQRSKRVLIRERWAWVWARTHARVWTPRMEMYADKSLAWYIPRAKHIDARTESEARQNIPTL